MIKLKNGEVMLLNGKLWGDKEDWYGCKDLKEGKMTEEVAVEKREGDFLGRSWYFLFGLRWGVEEEQFRNGFEK